MDEQKPEDSVEDWISRAQRARALVGRVDLDGIADHDPQAIEKLIKVTDALGELSEGRNVDYIPGVDEDEAPEMDADQLRRSQLMVVLAEAGLSERLGRIYMQGDDTPIKVIDLIPHRDGLPAFDVCLAPDHSPTEGAHGIFVSERGVFAAVVPEPVTRHKWRILRSRPFDDFHEMLATVQKFMNAH
jgi:hypothetical protein